MNLMAPPKEGPKILLYDIETSPSLVYTWTQWKTNVIATKKDWEIMSFAYRWYGDKRIGYVDMRGKEDDRDVVAALHKLHDAADVVVAHNGDKFDQKKANTRFLFHKLPPPSPYRQIDTLKEAKRYFNHYSSALGELGRYHQLGDKIKHEGIGLWLACLADDWAAWNRMKKYNKQDVALLTELYEELTPWIGHPGHTTIGRGHWEGGKLACAKLTCGSTNVIKRGFHRMGVNMVQTIECKECGGYSRMRETVFRPMGDRMVTS